MFDPRLRYSTVWPVALVVLLAVACASTPPDRVAYNTIRGAVVSVQAGMSGFNVIYQSGKATEADRERVLAAYAKFQKTAALAIDIAASLPPGQEPNVVALVNVAAQDVFDLLKVWGLLPQKEPK
jgi:hypothetical protein